MTRTWLLGGVALVVAACSGAAATSGPGDGGEGGAAGQDAAGDGQPGEDSGHSDAKTDADTGADGGGGGHDAGGVDGTTHDASGSGGADAGSDAAWTIDVPTDIPQVVDNGAAVLKAPVFQSISFPGYDQTTAIDSFVATVGTTTYWHDAVAEYGVGTPTVEPPVHLTQAAPKTIDDTTIQSWLATTVAANVGLMAPSANAFYVISYPSTTTVTLETVYTSCTDFGAYHNSAAIGGVQVAYAVVPECTYAPSTTLQTSTDSLSHELAEGSADPIPLPFSSSAWQGTDVGHTFWEVIAGGDGELGDMCSFFYTSFFTPPGYAYDVQRIWSNTAALQGHDPCQPELPGEVYFTGVPLMPNSVPIVWDTQTGYTTEGVQIAVGASKTIPVQLYSEGPMAPWSVAAVEYPSSKNLKLAWDTTTGQNGDTLNLTITVSGTDSTYGGNAFIIESTSGSVTNMWLGFVGR